MLKSLKGEAGGVSIKVETVNVYVSNWEKKKELKDVVREANKWLTSKREWLEC